MIVLMIGPEDIPRILALVVASSVALFAPARAKAQAAPICLESGIQGEKLSDGVDHWTGANKGDKVTGLRGKDVLKGRGGNDLLNGGRDNDKVYGDDGDDIICGGRSADKLFGGDGDDVIY